MAVFVWEAVAGEVGEMKTRIERDAETLMIIDRRRETEGPGVGTSIEHQIIKQHLMEIEADVIATDIVRQCSREARINDQRHAAHHEASVARKHHQEAEARVQRLHTAVLCLLLALEAETTWIASLMGWLS